MTVYTQFDLLLNALMYCKMYKFLNICTFTLNTIRFKRTLNVMSTEPLQRQTQRNCIFTLFSQAWFIFLIISFQLINLHVLICLNV